MTKSAGGMAMMVRKRYEGQIFIITGTIISKKSVYFVEMVRLFKKKCLFRRDGKIIQKKVFISSDGRNISLVEGRDDRNRVEMVESRVAGSIISIPEGSRLARVEIEVEMVETDQKK